MPAPRSRPDPALGQGPPAVVAGIAAAVLGVALATALIGWLRAQTGAPNLAMLYLLVVLGLASTLGWFSAVLAALLAFLAFNFFFVEPLHTLHVADPQELLALGILLITAMVTGQLAAALRARAREAELREREVTALYELSQLFGQEGSLEQRLAAVARRLADLLRTGGCEILLPARDGRLVMQAAHGAVAAGRAGAEQATAWAFANGGPAAPGQYFADRRWVRIAGPRNRRADERTDVLCLPLLAGERTLGVVRLVGFPPERLLQRGELGRLRALAGLLAQAVERERLATEATETEVLRRADQTKSALLSSVSHDLRTPLASIKASATNLLDEDVDWDPAARRELLVAIDEETDRLTRFVSRLLELTRVEGGTVQPARDWHAVGEILADVAERLDPPGERVRLDVPPDLPLAHVDYVMVQQIVANLVENALKYSPDDAAVGVRAEARDGRLCIEVADRGAGVSPPERERIFEKFYRVPHGATAVPGTGIGLAIARGLAQAHDGDVRYAPRPGGGSVFSVSLPLRQGDGGWEQVRFAGIGDGEEKILAPDPPVGTP